MGVTIQHYSEINLLFQNQGDFLQLKTTKLATRNRIQKNV